MKRIILLLMMLSVLVCVTPCFAEAARDDVLAKFVENDTDCGRSVVNSGNASITLADGTVIEACNIPSDRYTLYAKEITSADPSAMQWFSQCLSDKTILFCPFDICLLDGNTRVTLTSEIDIRITYTKAYNDKVLFLGTDGTITAPDCSVGNGISFRSNLTAYCIIAHKEHKYGAPNFQWNGYTCTASVVCGCKDAQEIPCEVTSAITKEATEKTEGIRTYTATAQYEGTTYTSDVHPTESIPKVQKENVFTRIINAIKNFFKKLFSFHF